MIDSASFLSIKNHLPEYFESKLKKIKRQSANVRDDLLEAEAERYKVAAYIADTVAFDLKKAVKLAQETVTDQLIQLPELRNTSHILDLRSPVLLSAIQYICHENEKLLNSTAAAALAPSPLPPYFAKKLSGDAKLEEIFRQATLTAEESGFQLAAVLEKKREQPTTKVALQAIRYTCYIMDHQQEEKRYLTRKGSRIELLGPL